MKECPILFSAPMVRALLAGTKTQTRRIIKPQPIQNGFGPPDGVYDIPCHCDYYPPSAMLWPDRNGGMLNGDAGHPWLGIDRLWVKETFCVADDGVDNPFAFRADNWTECPAADGKWKPSIFMPRAASRITLEIEDVRAERLQAISEADAKAEGVKAWQSEGYRVAHNIFDGHKLAYAELWNEINGAGSWALNPWVWVIAFKRITP